MKTDSDVNKAICIPERKGKDVWCQSPLIFLYTAIFSTEWRLVLDWVPAVNEWEAGMHPGPVGAIVIHFWGQFRVSSHPDEELRSCSWTLGYLQPGEYSCRPWETNATRTSAPSCYWGMGHSTQGPQITERTLEFFLVLITNLHSSMSIPGIM